MIFSILLTVFVSVACENTIKYEYDLNDGKMTILGQLSTADTTHTIFLSMSYPDRIDSLPGATDDVLTASDGREVPVVYSMGNFLSDMTETITKDNIYLKVQLKRNDEGQVVIADEKYVPCHIYKEFKGRIYSLTPNL